MNGKYFFLLDFSGKYSILYPSLVQPKVHTGQHYYYYYFFFLLNNKNSASEFIADS